MELTEEIKEKLRKEIKERIKNVNMSRSNMYLVGVVISCNDVKEINIIEDVWKKSGDLKNYSLEHKLYAYKTLALRLSLKTETVNHFNGKEEENVFIEGFDSVVTYIERMKEVIPFSDLLKKCSK